MTTDNIKVQKKVVPYKTKEQDLFMRIEKNKSGVIMYFYLEDSEVILTPICKFLPLYKAKEIYPHPFFSVYIKNANQQTEKIVNAALSNIIKEALVIHEMDKAFKEWKINFSFVLKREDKQP